MLCADARPPFISLKSMYSDVHFIFFFFCDYSSCGNVGRQPMNLQTGRIKLKQVRQEKQHRFICARNEKGEE